MWRTFFSRVPPERRKCVSVCIVALCTFTCSREILLVFTCTRKRIRDKRRRKDGRAHISRRIPAHTDPPTKVYTQLLSNPRTGIGSTSAIQLSYIKSARRCNKMWRTKRSGWSPRWTGENAPFDITGRLFSSCKAPSFSPSLFWRFVLSFPSVLYLPSRHHMV